MYSITQGMRFTQSMKKDLKKHEISDYKSDVTKADVLKDIEKVALFKPLSSAESQRQASLKT